MRFLHLGDLHIGKRVNEFSMVEDQRHVLGQVCKLAADEGVDCVVVAGDFYDKPVPSEQAVVLAGWFLEELHAADVPVLVVPGNHDSAERLSFLSSVVGHEGIHIAHPYSGEVESVVLSDDGGDVAFHLLPYVTPADARRWHEGCEARTFDEAMRCIVGNMQPVGGARNVLVAHQLVLGATSPLRCDSEQTSIGGLDEVGSDVFDGFDYVALGHLHSPQWIVPGKVRYCGSPLKYSFSEVAQRKVANIVDIGPDGHVELDEVPLTAPHDMAELTGTLEEVRNSAAARPELSECYMRVVLQEPVENARAKLQDMFPLLMRVEFDYGREGVESLGRTGDSAVRDVAEMDPGDVFSSLFESTNGRAMNDAERDVFAEIAARLTEGGVE